MDSRSLAVIFASIFVCLFVSAEASSAKATTLVALNVAKKESTHTADFFNKLAVSYPQFKKPLHECASLFKESTMFLNLRGLEGDTASLDVHYALDEVDRCQTSLASANAHIPQVQPQIQKWKSLFNVAYSGVIAVENGKN